MDAKQGGYVLFVENLRYLLVGRDHQLLDQAVRLGLSDRDETNDAAGAIELELGLLAALDRERGTRRTSCRQRTSATASGREWLAPGVLGALAPVEDSVDLLVGQPSVGADHRAVARRTAHLIAGDRHFDRDRQPILRGHARAGGGGSGSR